MLSATYATRLRCSPKGIADGVHSRNPREPKNWIADDSAITIATAPSLHDWQDAAACKAKAIFEQHNIALTLGGEPTFLPIHPNGNEWSFTALGPTKLDYARKFANSLIKHYLPNSISILSPGKFYPGEVDARWVLKIIQSPNNKPWFEDQCPKIASIRALKAYLSRKLRCGNHWMDFRDSKASSRTVHVLPLGYADQKWNSAYWSIPTNQRVLINARGAAGLRLPLSLLSNNELKSALVIDQEDQTLHIFIPPLSKEAFLELLPILGATYRTAEITHVELHGYVPPDLYESCTVVCFAADPGVLEVNIPPCKSWHEYRQWLIALEQCAHEIGMRSWKDGIFPSGTGGGNHLIAGGPALDANPFFTRPKWIAAILRYCQRHPSLAYAFTGNYVGSSSQAPRPDESGIEFIELQMGLEHLDALAQADNVWATNGDRSADIREHIQQALCHFLVDASGNPHRAEISIDKFWNTYAPGGQLGLIEFRAIESLPHAEWSAHVGLLWYAILARLATKPYREKMVNFSHALHDTYMLPYFLRQDLLNILDDLRQHQLELNIDAYTTILDWRFPTLLEFEDNEGAQLTIRKAHEPWPLLSEIPNEGALTSRFVDTSLRRLEFHANRQFHKTHHVTINCRQLPLHQAAPDHYVSGCRYRHSKLSPSLHSQIPTHYPLELVVSNKHSQKRYAFTFNESDRQFRAIKTTKFLETTSKCKRHPSAFWTYDLRLK